MPLNQAYKGFIYFFNGLSVCLKLCICVLTQASALSWVSFKLSPNRHWLFRQLSTRVECPSFLPVISLGCFLSFDIFHCLNCNTFVSRYSPQCNAVKSLLESFILHCSRLIAHRALQLSRVLTPGHWTGLVFLSSACMRLFFVRSIFLPMARINPQMLFKILPSASFSCKFRDKLFSLVLLANASFYLNVKKEIWECMTTSSLCRDW